MPPWKRALDLLILVVLSPVILPVGLVLMTYIRLVSPGPAFFRQTRIGRGGAPFTCFKFRTMKVNASTSGHQEHLKELIQSNEPMVKLDHKGDSRLIRGGALLRASGLDELAQLINVARGDMSIVGPRPCLPYEFAQYSARHKARLSVLPGITGLWQVEGKNRTTFEEMIALDIRYAGRLSIWSDLRILIRTFGVLCGQMGEALFPVSRPDERKVLRPLEARK